MYLSIPSISVLILLGFGSASPSPELPDWPIPSVWELVEIEPVPPQESSPLGVSNRREYYTADGRLCWLMPNETYSDESLCVAVRFDAGERILDLPNGSESRSAVLALDSETATLRLPDDGEYRFRRLALGSVEGPIRLRSLHVLDTGGEGPSRVQDVEYSIPRRTDTPDAVIGVWEVLELWDVDPMELPPYGFSNDKWVFTGKFLVVLSADQTRMGDGRVEAYEIDGERLGLPESRETFHWSFDRWDDLVLDSESRGMRLRQLSDDPEQIPVIPWKVAVLNTGGD